MPFSGGDRGWSACPLDRTVDQRAECTYSTAGGPLAGVLPNADRAVSCAAWCSRRCSCDGLEAMSAGHVRVLAAELRSLLESAQGPMADIIPIRPRDW
jgi:hypothetical protein